MQKYRHCMLIKKFYQNIQWWFSVLFTHWKKSKMNILRTRQVIEKLKTLCRFIIKARQTIFYDTAPSTVCFFIFVQTVKPTRFVWLVWLTLRSSEVLRMANAFTPRSTDPGKQFLSPTYRSEVFFASSILFSEWRWSKSRRSLWKKSTSCGVSYVLFWMWEDKTSYVKSKKYLNHRRNLPTIKLSLLPRELGEVSECYRHSRKRARVWSWNRLVINKLISRCVRMACDSLFTTSTVGPSIGLTF